MQMPFPAARPPADMIAAHFSLPKHGRHYHEPGTVVSGDWYQMPCPVRRPAQQFGFAFARDQLWNGSLFYIRLAMSSAIPHLPSPEQDSLDSLKLDIRHRLRTAAR